MCVYIIINYFKNNLHYLYKGVLLYVLGEKELPGTRSGTEGGMSSKLVGW